MKRYLFRFTVLLLSAALLLVPAGCSDPARNMSFDEAMEKYEWERSEVRDYVFDSYRGSDIVEELEFRGKFDPVDYVLERYPTDEILERLWDIDPGMVMDFVFDELN